MHSTHSFLTLGEENAMGGAKDGYREPRRGDSSCPCLSQLATTYPQSAELTRHGHAVWECVYGHACPAVGVGMCKRMARLKAPSTLH